jgi:hypothetical protein
MGGTRRLAEDWVRLSLTADGRTGYARVTLRRDGRSFRHAVHTLVLTAFVGAKPDGMEACHSPIRDRTDNRLCNLRWDTAASNQADRIAHGTSVRGSQLAHSRLSEEDIPVIVGLRTGPNNTKFEDISMRFGVSQSAISAIFRGDNWAWLTGIKPGDHTSRRPRPKRRRPEPITDGPDAAEFPALAGLAEAAGVATCNHDVDNVPA